MLALAVKLVFLVVPKIVRVVAPKRDASKVRASCVCRNCWNRIELALQGLDSSPLQSARAGPIASPRPNAPRSDQQRQPLRAIALADRSAQVRVRCRSHHVTNILLRRIRTTQPTWIPTSGRSTKWLHPRAPRILLTCPALPTHLPELSTPNSKCRRGSARRAATTLRRSTFGLSPSIFAAPLADSCRQRILR